MVKEEKPQEIVGKKGNKEEKPKKSLLSSVKNLFSKKSPIEPLQQDVAVDAYQRLYHLISEAIRIDKESYEKEAKDDDDYKSDTETKHQELIDTILSINSQKKSYKKGKQKSKKDEKETTKATKAPKTTEPPKTVGTSKTQPVTKTKPIPPSAEPAVPSTAGSTLGTLGKIVAGAAVVGLATSGISKAIGGAESGGNYNITFGDSLDKKGNVVRGPYLSPEKRYGKNLTELTLAEIDALGKERNRANDSTSAMGKYQFMNTTLFGSKDKKGNFRPGLVQKYGKELNIDMNTKFTPDVQDKLYEKLHEQDTETMRKLGVPLTPGYEYMSHYIGPGGAKAVYDNRNTGKTVQEAVISAGLSDPVRKAKNGKLINAELATIKASEFESVLEKRLLKQGLKPHATPTPQDVPNENKTGEKIDKESKTNTELRKDGEKHSSIFIQNNTLVNHGGNKDISILANVNDKPIFQRLYG